MKEIALQVDGLAVRWTAPRAADLPLAGELTDHGVARRAVAAVDVPRALPVSVEPAPAQKAGLTISEAERLITDRATGKYPHDSPFRQELVRALRFAAEQWGADTLWESIDESHWTALLRARVEQLVAKGCKAVRATEITVGRLITVVGWLRDTKRIPRDSAQWPRLWKQDVTKYWKGLVGTDRDPEPSRLRYTRDEFQRILKASDFDPRLFLLLQLAAGLRPGQVARARRSDLTLPPIDGDSFGILRVRGAGKKGGAIVDLTPGQRQAIDDALAGYLATVEAGYQAKARADYVLFPTGYIVGRVGMLRGKETTLTLSDHADFAKSVTGSWIRKSWRVAEKRAGIEHQHGRATYGQRRLMVDEVVAAELSPSGIQAAGGWSDTKMPLTVYAEKENRTGRREARPVRARMLGEEVQV